MSRDTAPMTVLCLASYEKGHEFLREAKRQGARVLLLTSHSLKDSARWPEESIDEIFYMPDERKQWNRTDTLKAVSYLARTHALDRIVPLDDFDLEVAAMLREHLRLPGLGESKTRFFRDKLAMRLQAREAGLHVPDFVGLIHHGRVQEYLDRVPPPWVIKPRLFAGSIGIQVVHEQRAFWEFVHAAGDEQSFFLVEHYVPGDVFHVDSIVTKGEVRFAIASGYGRPPLDVSQQGGIFTTRILERGTEIEQALLAKNARVLAAMGLTDGVSHTEFILSREGKLYFLETSARVGGAHIAELVDAATGVNLWAEWAKLELLADGAGYQVAAAREEYGGLLVSLANQERPDTSGFGDPEVVWRMDRPHHVGIILRSQSYVRISELLDNYVARVQQQYAATAPPLNRPNE
jgi:biotin carboxylase